MAVGLMLTRQQLSRLDVRRKIHNVLMLLVLLALASLALVPLIGISIYILRAGLPALNWSFLTHNPAPVGETGGGMGNALLGSAVLVGLASLVGVPWGIAIGVYLSEFGRGKFAWVLRFAIDLFATVPSIIIGLFIYAVVVVPMHGFSAYAGSLALGLIMLPTAARSTEEILKLVPNHIREAGLALGVPRWRVILSIVLRGSLSGVFTGVMLAVARAAGETAPLLFTAFNNRTWSTSLNQPIASLPVQIYNFAISPFEDWHNQAWAGALLLVAFVFVLNVGTRLSLHRGRRPRSS